MRAAQGDADGAEQLLLTGYQGLRETASTPPLRLRAAVQRLVSFYAGIGRAADAESWRSRLEEDESQ